MPISPKQISRSNGRAGRSLFNVLVVGNRPVVRLGISAIIRDCPDFKLYSEVADTAEALQAAKLGKPDLAVVDIDVRNQLGLSFIHELKRAWHGVSILTLSHQPDAYFAGQVLAAGATGYVTIWEGLPALTEAMQTVARGQTYLRASLLSMFGGSRGHNGTVSIDDPTLRLTERELQVFDLIGSGDSTKKIARRLRLSVHTIETYRERIRCKLGDLDGAELVYQAIVWKLLNG
jgi:DNA-binding NarL/FixJ family response regulator